jgi:hypothetical protein
MTTAVQVQYRRGSSAQVASFTGAQGEMVVDTTNNRVVVQDGSTAGGWPAAKLTEVQTNTRTQVSDGNYTAQTTDRLVAYITITAARTVSLPAASTFPGGSRLLVVDESGGCSATNTITLAANGSDLVDGAASALIQSAYGYMAVESNTFNKWTIVDVTPAPGGVTSVNTLTGAVTLATSDGSSISLSGSTLTIGGGPGGMVNKFHNATMDVWQRGTSGTVTTSGGYTADGWIVLPTGAGVPWGQAAGRLLTKNSLQVTGAASVTDVKIKQRIESLMAATFCSQTVTVQARVYNGTGASITPTLTVNRPSAQDNYGTTTTDVNATSLQACANGTWTGVAYTFSANAASYNGLEILFDFGNNFGANTKTIAITELDIRVTPGAATGINYNPAPPELRPIATELAFCQRYFTTSYGNGTAPGTATHNGMVYVASYLSGTGYFGNTIYLPVQMRAAPTIATWDGAGNSGDLSYTSTGVGTSFTDAITNTGAGAFAIGPGSFMFAGYHSATSGVYAIHHSASAEL